MATVKLQEIFGRNALSVDTDTSFEAPKTVVSRFGKFVDEYGKKVKANNTTYIAGKDGVLTKK